MFLTVTNTLQRLKFETEELKNMELIENNSGEYFGGSARFTLLA